MANTFVCGRFDCFANQNGHCMGIKEPTEGAGCSFFKTHRKMVNEHYENYQKLVKKDRKDLIEKYGMEPIWR